jgi:predicted transcriptional regulator
MTQQNEQQASEGRHGPRGLGALEAQLMGLLWGTADKLTVQGVVDGLGPGHNYKTVMTVLNRLVDKELLQRELDGRAYRYHPKQSRDEFLRSVADELVGGYLESYGAGSGAHLTSAVDAALPRPATANASAGAGASAGALGEPAGGPTTPPQYYDDDDDHRPSIAGIIGIAAALQLITLLLGRRKRK